MCSRRSTASRSGRRLAAACFCLSAALALSAGAARADWQDDYKAAVAAQNRSEHDRAIDLLMRAIRDKPKEKASAIKSTGMFFEPYLPHYYLGLAYYGKKDYANALKELRASASQGVVSKYAEHNSRLEFHLKLCEQQVAAGAGAAPPPPQRDDTEARALAQAKEGSGQALQTAEAFLQRRGKELAPHERASVETAMRELSQAADTASILRETGELKGAVESAEGRLTARATRPEVPAGGTSPPAPRETPARELGRMPPGSGGGGAPASPSRTDPVPPPRPAPGSSTRVTPPAPPPAPVEPAPPPRGDRLSPESAARVRRGVESYYKGDDEGAIAAFSGLAQEQADAVFYLGSALYRKFLLGREKDASLREEAARHFKRAAELSPGYRPDPRYISPKVIAFFERATAGL